MGNFASQFVLILCGLWRKLFNKTQGLKLSPRVLKDCSRRIKHLQQFEMIDEV